MSIVVTHECITAVGLSSMCMLMFQFVFTILLYCISNAFAPINVDIVCQENIIIHSSYITVGFCPWSANFIAYLVKHCKNTFC